MNLDNQIVLLRFGSARIRMVRVGQSSDFFYIFPLKAQKLSEIKNLDASYFAANFTPYTSTALHLILLLEMSTKIWKKGILFMFDQISEILNIFPNEYLKLFPILSMCIKAQNIPQNVVSLEAPITIIIQVCTIF